MTSILLVGDLHYHTNNGLESELLSKFIVNLVKERNFDLVVFLGDLSHTNSRLHSKPLKRLTDLLGTVSETVPICVVMGNHDLPGQNAYITDDHGFNFLKWWTGTKKETEFPSGTGVQLVDRPLNFKIKNTQFTACPYVAPGRFLEALETVEGWKDSKFVFCHQTLQGCQEGGHTLSAKDSWSLDLPTIYSGHIHDPQVLTSGVHYTGSAWQTRINEDPFNKALVVLTLEEDGEYDEERILTNIEPKLEVRIRTTDISTTEVPDECKARIEITGSLIENEVAKKLAKVRAWQKKHDVRFNNLPQTKKRVEEPTVAYKTYCLKRAEKEGVVELIEEAFVMHGL